jgi:heptosyltransferase-2
MATPAIENILSHYLDSELIVLGSAVSVPVFSEHPRCRKTIILNKSYGALFKTAKQIQPADIFFTFRSSLRSRFFKFLVPAYKKYQFDKNTFTQGHQVERYNHFVNTSLSLTNEAGPLCIYRKQSRVKKKMPLLGINPGASYGSAKRWYPEEFAKVAKTLSSQFDILIFAGPNELEIANDIEKSLQKSGIKNYTNMAGKTSIDGLINAIANLDIMITGDSGPMHIAAAFQIPTVSIFGPTKHKETSQWKNKKNIIIKKDLPCQPCMRRTCPLGHHDCMRQIKAEEVIEAAYALI